MKTFDQSLKYLLAHDTHDLLAFALDDATVEVIKPVKVSLPARGRDVDGSFRVRTRGDERVAHVEFHRRNQSRDDLAVDVAEAQIRLYRRERVEVLSLVWDLYGDRAAPVLSTCALTYASGSVSRYTRINLRGTVWHALLSGKHRALWPLVALTADGACEEGVRAAHDAIVARDDLSASRKADHLAVLWFVAEREDVAVTIMQTYIREEELMQSALYQQIVARGELNAERRMMADLCDVLGIAYTPEREAWVRGLDLVQLASLRAHLKQRRAWPDATP